MAHYRLTVKGDIHEAKAAVTARGLPYIDEWENPRADSTFVRIEATDEVLAILTEWLSERPPFIRGFGYPAGTLLHFRRQEDDDAL